MNAQELGRSAIGLLTGRETRVKLPDNLRLSVHNSSRAPRVYMHEAQRSAQVAIAKVRGLISIRDCNIDLSLYEPTKDIEDIDPFACGFTMDDGVFVRIYSTSPEFKEEHDICTQGVIAHELHHFVRMGGPGMGKTLLQLLVTEGLALSFAADYFGHTWIREHPQLGGITEQQIHFYWTMVKAQVFANSQNVYYPNWFGHFVPGKDLPPQIGYLLGYSLVRSYLRTHPDETPASLAQAPAERFIESVVC